MSEDDAVKKDAETEQQCLEQPQAESCIAGMTRREFVDRLVTRGKIAGTLIVSAAVMDIFLAKPAQAAPTFN